MEKTSKELTLSHFIEKHPGLEHKAGVTKGGTFVIIYQDYSVIPKTPVRKTQSNLVAAAPSAASKVANVTLASTLTPATLKSDVFSVSIEDYKNKIQAYASYFLPKDSYTHLVEYMDNFISATSIKDDLYGIPDQAVIADFYLPYMCCSEGSSINFVLGNDIAMGPADLKIQILVQPIFYQ